MAQGIRCSAGAAAEAPLVGPTTAANSAKDEDTAAARSSDWACAAICAGAC